MEYGGKCQDVSEALGIGLEVCSGVLEYAVKYGSMVGAPKYQFSPVLIRHIGRELVLSSKFDVVLNDVKTKIIRDRGRKFLLDGSIQFWFWHHSIKPSTLNSALPFSGSVPMRERIVRRKIRIYF